MNRTTVTDLRAMHARLARLLATRGIAATVLHHGSATNGVAYSLQVEHSQIWLGRTRREAYSALWSMARVLEILEDKEK